MLIRKNIKRHLQYSVHWGCYIGHSHGLSVFWLPPTWTQLNLRSRHTCDSHLHLLWWTSPIRSRAQRKGAVEWKQNNHINSVDAYVSSANACSSSITTTHLFGVYLVGLKWQIYVSETRCFVHCFSRDILHAFVSQLKGLCSHSGPPLKANGSGDGHLIDCPCR